MSLITALEYGMEWWNGKWVIVHNYNQLLALFPASAQPSFSIACSTEKR